MSLTPSLSDFHIRAIPLLGLPSALHSLKQAPRLLYVQGSPRAFELLDRLPECGLAIVGTRLPQNRSVRLLQEWLPLWQNAAPLIIVSGLARGIDARAHELALEWRIPTVAIQGSALDVPYPPEHEPLRRRILEADGLVISEYPPGTRARPAHFIQRNRLIVAFSKAVWIVEAGLRSGALNTASWARKYSRELYVTPAFPGDPAFAGNVALMHHDHVNALWAPHFLGQSWITLATCGKAPEPGTRAGAPPDSDEGALAREVRRLCRRSGGASVQMLLDWALDRMWSPQRYFEALQCAMSQGLIRDRQGNLVA